MDACNPIGRVNFSRILKKISDFESDYRHVCNSIEKLKKDMEVSKQIVDSGFQYENELRNMRTRQKEINDILNQDNQTPIVSISEEEELSEFNDMEYAVA